MPDADSFSWSHELIKGGITVASVAMGGWLALKNYRSNAWWDAKRKAYEEAIQHLESLLTTSRELRNLYAEAEAHAAPDAPQVKAALALRYLDQIKNLAPILSRSSYLQSDEAADLIISMTRKLLDAAHSSPQKPFHDDFHVILSTLSELVEISRIDLGLASFPTRLRRRWKKLRAWAQRLWAGSAGFRTEAGPKAKHLGWCVLLGHEKAEKRRTARALGALDPAPPGGIGG